MFQKFNEDTLVARFIQNIVYNTYIPNYKSVWEGDFVAEGCFYVYEKTIVKCTKSGFLGEDAEITLVNYFNVNNPDYTYMSNIYSRNNYYDTDTHEQLGKQLRYLKYNENLDLMPFYNCFSARYTSNFHIQYKEYREGSDSSKQVVLVPILYDREYTIALDCNYQIELLPVVLSDLEPLILVYNGEVLELNELLKEFYQARVRTSFKHPFTFKLDLSDPSLIYYASVLEQNAKGLYLAIQLPADNTSSIVVLEGNYLNNTVEKHVDMSHIHDMSQKEIDEILISELSLLRLNDNNSYAFSDRLVEYLTLNAINCSETIDDNITMVQKLLNMNTYNSLSYDGVWTDDIRYKAYDAYKMGRNIDYRFEMIDINGFIDKDIEQLLIKGASNAV